MIVLSHWLLECYFIVFHFLFSCWQDLLLAIVYVSVQFIFFFFGFIMSDSLILFENKSWTNFWAICLTIHILQTIIGELAKSLCILFLFLRKLIGNILLALFLIKHLLNTDHNWWIGFYCWQRGNQPVLQYGHAEAEEEGYPRGWQGTEGQKFQFNAYWRLIQQNAN